MEKIDPIRPTDDDARTLAHDLLAQSRTAALGVLTPETGEPHVTRIAMSRLTDGRLITLVSDLAFHTRALVANGSCSLLIGETGRKGDPLNQPRLTLAAQAREIEKSPALCDAWLAQHPKAKLYINFADFRFFEFTVRHGALNGGFGKAFALTAKDLT